jgi:hypothetical protein
LAIATNDHKYLKIRFVFAANRINICLVQSSNPMGHARGCSERIRMPALLCRFPFASVFRPRRPPAVARASQLEARVAAAAPPSALNSELEELRGAAMRRMFPKLFSWCANRWDRGMAIEVHAYLAGATSVDDLEQRIRTVERRRHFSS